MGTIRWLVCNCLLGLESLHNSHKILHRDIKEENLLIDKHGYARLADFGMADKLKNGVSYAHGGTLPYMSPESRDKGDKKAQRVTHDFFAVGVMMYRMCCNHYPFDMHEHNYNTVLALHLNERAQEKDMKTTLVREDEINFEREMLPEHYKLDREFVLKKSGGDEVFVDLVQKLTVMKEDCRLGAKGGVEAIMKHKFFDGVDWEAIKNKKAPSPCVPKPNDMATICRGDLDVFEQVRRGRGRRDKVFFVTPPRQSKLTPSHYFRPTRLLSTPTQRRSRRSGLGMSPTRCLRIFITTPGTRRTVTATAYPVAAATSGRVVGGKTGDCRGRRR